ncbi:N-acetylmuramoyl-L-alanine amidase [Deinococcus sp. Leaf326]|uniref:N-acetylmuramoyl-L-alanine amidase n=1 Tax=Deinococcus sp. Leaf326 TaxID=1736338 RepID=UPI0006F9030C|nr:N-acetylmuramoyl-L-alanine amidase [Deinococcus sp. Leaf326]KQQ99437.1 N-acetylmuramoyl-L-alanine amidase [Deinococcus sp. Leaf326]
MPPASLRRGLSALLLASLPGAALAAPTVYVAYPPPDHRVTADHVILEGRVTPGAALKIGAQSVAVGADGLFMLWWPLKSGVNDLRLVATRAGQTGRRTVRVTRSVPGPLPARPTAIAPGDLLPAADLEFWDAAGDTPAERRVRLGFRGSPGGQATVRVGGGPAQPLRESPAGTYSAEVTVSPQTPLVRAEVSFTLTGRDSRRVTRSAPGHLSVSGPVLAAAGAGTRTGTQRPGSVPGQGLNSAETVLRDAAGRPVLYPRDGMTFAVVGRRGDDLRVRLAPGLSAFARAEDLVLMPGTPTPVVAGPLVVDDLAASQTPAAAGTLPAQTLAAQMPPVPVLAPAPGPATPDAASGPALPELTPLAVPALPAAPLVPGLPAASPVPVAPAGDLRLRLSLGGARVPFGLTQPQAGQLVLTLYGLAAPPVLGALSDPLLAGVVVTSPAPGVTHLAVNLRAAQLWGFTAGYEDGDLVLAVRRPPSLDPARPLAGRVITLDPGHGGTQAGGAGSFGVPEKGLMLPIALRAAELLRAQGATVVLTRTADVTLGLYERGGQAEAARADLLVSIHANALPDGRDPRGVRGPEVYFTHPQAQGVAASVLAALRARLPELGAGRGLMPGADLALTRPSTQPSLLIETAYLTDPGNLRALSSADGRERFAQAIAGGIAAYYAAQAR